MAARYHAVDRNSAAGPDQHDIADLYFGETSRCHLAGRSHLGSLRQQVQQFPDGASAAPHRHALQHFGDQHEHGDEQAVKNSPMTDAATSAMVMESSMVMRRSTRSAIASLKMG